MDGINRVFNFVEELPIAAEKTPNAEEAPDMPV
jgi:hypothetical protein